MPETHSATDAMPALPGRQYSFSRSEDCLIFQQIECSVPIGTVSELSFKYFHENTIIDVDAQCLKERELVSA
eukprot:751362-Hanusia_phi.AAC.3